MAGRDLSAELFGDSPAPKAGGRDLSADLFGDAPAPARAAAPLSRMEKFGRGLMDPISGGAQLLTNMLPEGLVNAGNKANNWLADKTGMVARLPAGGVDQQVREQEADYAARRKAAGESGIDGYRLIGNVLSPANAALATRAPAAASLAGRIGIGMASGAASSALAPVAGGDFWSEKGQQVATGAALGGALPAVTAGLGRVVSPNASRNGNLQLLRKEGVTPTIGQALGGRFNAFEEKAASLPILGDMITKRRMDANDQFQTAAFKRALNPIGEVLPDGLSGRDAVNFTEGILKDRYDKVLTSIGAIRGDTQLVRGLSSLQKKVDGMMMPATEKTKFNGVLSEMLESFDQNSFITSDVFKRLESSLGTDARTLTRSQNIYEGKVGEAVKQLQAELRGLLERQAGPQADELKAVNTGWANFKRVQNAAAKIGADDGEFTPAQFQNAVRALDKSKDKGAFARGSALGQDLGDAGKTVLGNKVPNSGTADRSLLNLTLLGGTAAVNPTAAAGVLGGAGLYLSPAQRALVAAVASRPQSAEGAAKALRKVAPVAIPGFTQLGLQMRE